MLKKYFFTLALGLILASCATMGGKGDLKVDFDEFQKILSPRSMVLLEGQNAMLMTIARPGDTYPKVYRYDFKTKSFTMLYDHGQGVSSLSESRTGKTIFLHIDNKGDENTKIYTFDPVAKKATLLFGKDGFKAYTANTDQKDTTLFFVSNHENKSVYSIFAMDMATKKVTRLSNGKTNLMGALVTPDGTFVVASRYLSNNENQVFLINTKNKTTKRIFKKKDSVFHPAFVDGKTMSVYGVTDYKRDRQGCAKIPMNKPNHVYFMMQ